jgi:hypothetical protein
MYLKSLKATGGKNNKMIGENKRNSTQEDDI